MNSRKTIGMSLAKQAYLPGFTLIALLVVIAISALYCSNCTLMNIEFRFHEKPA